VTRARSVGEPALPVAPRRPGARVDAGRRRRADRAGRGQREAQQAGLRRPRAPQANGGVRPDARPIGRSRPGPHAGIRTRRRGVHRRGPCRRRRGVHRRGGRRGPVRPIGRVSPLRHPVGSLGRPLVGPPAQRPVGPLGRRPVGPLGRRPVLGAGLPRGAVGSSSVKTGALPRVEAWLGGGSLPAGARVRVPATGPPRPGNGPPPAVTPRPERSSAGARLEGGRPPDGPARIALPGPGPASLVALTAPGLVGVGPPLGRIVLPGLRIAPGPVAVGPAPARIVLAGLRIEPGLAGIALLVPIAVELVETGMPRVAVAHQRVGPGQPENGSGLAPRRIGPPRRGPARRVPGTARPRRAAGVLAGLTAGPAVRPVRWARGPGRWATAPGRRVRGQARGPLAGTGEVVIARDATQVALHRRDRRRRARAVGTRSPSRHDGQARHNDRPGVEGRREWEGGHFPQRRCSDRVGRRRRIPAGASSARAGGR